MYYLRLVIWNQAPNATYIYASWRLDHDLFNVHHESLLHDIFSNAFDNDGDIHHQFAHNADNAWIQTEGLLGSNQAS